MELETPPLMAKTILNFHFDYWNPSLMYNCTDFSSRSFGETFGMITSYVEKYHHRVDRATGKTWLTVKHDFPFQDTCVGKGSAILVMLNQFDWKRLTFGRMTFMPLGFTLRTSPKEVLRTFEGDVLQAPSKKCVHRVREALKKLFFLWIDPKPVDPPPPHMHF